MTHPIPQPVARGLLCCCLTVHALSAPAIAETTGASETSAHTEAAAPSGSLTLGGALDKALSGNPLLIAEHAGLQAAEWDARQAGRIPNPDFEAGVENFAGNGPSPGFTYSETTLVLSQLVELGSKRARRRAVGDGALAVAQRDYEARRLQVIFETTAAFIDALAQRRLIGLGEQEIEIARNGLEDIRKQVAKGRLPAAAVPATELELQHRLIEQRARLRSGRAADIVLATYWGAASPDFSDLAGDLQDLPPLPAEDALVARIESSPEVARWRGEVALRRSEIALADSERVPDVLLSVGPRYTNGIDEWTMVAGVAFTLPVFDRNQDGRRAARETLSRSRALERDARLTLRRSLAVAYSELASSHDEIRMLRDTLIPTAEVSVDKTVLARQSGDLDITNVIAAHQDLHALRVRVLEALASHYTIRAHIEALIGGAIDEGAAQAAQPSQ